MPLLTIIAVLVVVGIIMYLVNRFIPMEQNIKNLLNIAVIVVLVLWLLKVIGLFDSVANVRV